MNIGTVVEGPTDRLVPEAVIASLIPGKHRYFRLQPQTAQSGLFSEKGTGWKGVRCWCQETWQKQGSGLGRIIAEGTRLKLYLKF